MIGSSAAVDIMLVLRQNNTKINNIQSFKRSFNYYPTSLSDIFFFCENYEKRRGEK
ncbi:hypothetical protein ADA01nite_18440 [Aneurinibacillus danicus]|uniref:Uncharacterized protein n=1 Tax=Aneurinibacillus danicus TaxID=267746 RepID=A0A511V605_9BACL|nr:hypothetical protein ADA01nite_18440 [Aneurinibacillus danicus]